VYRNNTSESLRVQARVSPQADNFHAAQFAIVPPQKVIALRLSWSKYIFVLGVS
jgi:hypothetical protein